MPAGRQATCRPRPMDTPPASATPPAFDAQALAGLLKDAPEQAFAEVARLARAGTVAAQTLLAQMLVEGRGTARDPEAAVLWYQVAANNGDALAMSMLGRCHELGEGTPANPALAAVWYRRAAGLGLDWGMYNLANLMATGRGLPRDEAGAYALYARAAALGHAKSMNLVARYLEEGRVVPADPQAALDWYRRAAEAGDFRGQANLASILLQQGEVAAAVALLRQALAHGSPAFLERIRPELATSPHPEIRALVAAHAPE